MQTTIVSEQDIQKSRRDQYYQQFEAVAQALKEGKVVKIHDPTINKKTLKRWLTQRLIHRYLIYPDYHDEDDHTFYVKRR